MMRNNFLSEKDTRSVNEILIRVLGIGEQKIVAEAAIMEDLGADSLHRTEIAMEVEDRFHLSMPEEEWEKVRTVGDLYQMLSKYLATRRCCS
jgi:acyl carrier protein